MLFTYIPLYYMLQDTMQLILVATGLVLITLPVMVTESESVYCMPVVFLVMSRFSRFELMPDSVHCII
jgi:cadmium resistance protein CadD (predicted permease)